jgi:hypothetical protein
VKRAALILNESLPGDPLRYGHRTSDHFHVVLGKVADICAHLFDIEHSVFAVGADCCSEPDKARVVSI